MNHDERMRLAVHINSHVVESYGEMIVVSGVFGSTALHRDMPGSDLEVLFITDGLLRVKRRQFLHRGIPVNLVVIRRESLERSLSEEPAASLYWWGILANLRLLHGDRARVEEWLGLADSLGRAQVADSLAAGLLSAHESYARGLSCCEPERSPDRAWAVADYLGQVHEMLGLLNRGWISSNPRSFTAIDEIAGFEKLPTGYRELATTAWISEDPARVRDSLLELHEGVRAILSEAGAAMPEDYHSPEELVAALEFSRG